MKKTMLFILLFSFFSSGAISAGETIKVYVTVHGPSAPEHCSQIESMVKNFLRLYPDVVIDEKGRNYNVKLDIAVAPITLAGGTIPGVTMSSVAILRDGYFADFHIVHIMGDDYLESQCESLVRSFDNSVLKAVREALGSLDSPGGTTPQKRSWWKK